MSKKSEKSERKSLDIHVEVALYKWIEKNRSEVMVTTDRQLTENFKADKGFEIRVNQFTNIRQRMGIIKPAGAAGVIAGRKLRQSGVPKIRLRQVARILRTLCERLGEDELAEEINTLLVEKLRFDTPEDKARRERNRQNGEQNGSHNDDD